MNFENIKSDGMQYEYKVVLKADEIEEGIVEAVKERAKTFKMQGFRKGHVPLNVVRNNVENLVMKDVFDHLISKACSAIIKDAKASDLASKPTYRFEGAYEKGKDVDLVLTIEIAPSFELKPYSIELEKIVPNISDQEVLDARSQLMLNSPMYEKADKEYAIKAKDEVSYKAICYNKGVESKKRSFSNSVLIPDMIPEGAEFLEKFIGKKIGETFDFVPATDKNLTYKVMVRSVNKALTDLSPDEYAVRRGFKDVSELDKVIKEKLERDLNAQAYLYHKNQVLEALEKQYMFDLPKGIVEREMRAVLNSIRRDLAEEAKKAKAENKEFKEKSDDELRKEYADVVNKRVLLGYVLNKIAKQENVTVSDREVHSLIVAEINRNPQMANALVKYYSGNPDAVAFKRAELIERKVIDFLISKAEAKEVQKTRKEVDEIVTKLLED